MRIKLLLILTLFLSLSIFAIEDEEIKVDPTTTYSLGDQTFAINIGMIFPMFFMDRTFDVTSTGAGTGVSAGGLGSLEFNTYLTNKISLGLEFGGMFAFSPNQNPFYMVPITLKSSYYFRFYPFEIPIHLGAGICLNKYEDSFRKDFILKPGASLFWYMNQEWSFGFNAIQWIVFNNYTGDLRNQSRIGNFLELTLSAMYHF